MMSEAVVTIQHNGPQSLRFARKPISEKKPDFGHSFIVGDKIIHIYANNLTEIVELEYIRDAESEEDYNQPLAAKERWTWKTQYPRTLPLEAVKASIDFAFMSAGLDSVFFLTSLPLLPLETRDDKRMASIKAFSALYPGIEPVQTELNLALLLYAEDQLARNQDI